MYRSPEELTAVFEDGTLEPAEFSHSDHVTVAHELLLKYDFLSAAKCYVECLKVLTEKAGVPQKVNTTVTLAFLSVIAERMHMRDYQDITAFLNGNKDLLSGDLLARWYTADRLKSEAARTRFLMPDHNPAVASK